MDSQLDGNFLPGSLPHKFILIVTLIICFVVNNFFFSLSPRAPCSCPNYLELPPDSIHSSDTFNSSRRHLKAHLSKQPLTPLVATSSTSNSLNSCDERCFINDK